MGEYHMRRRDESITAPSELDGIMRGQRLLTLAMCRDGGPNPVTLDCGYDPSSRCLCFHCARAGKKLGFLRTNPKVWG